MTSTLSVLLQRAQAGGEIPAEAGPAVVGRTLLALFEVLQVLARGGVDLAALAPVINQTFTLVATTAPSRQAT